MLMHFQIGMQFLQELLTHHNSPLNVTFTQVTLGNGSKN